MFIYKNTGKSISIYGFTPDKEKLIEFKKRYLENIKSVILHTFNKDVEGLLLNSRTIMFDALDRKEENGEISYIEETKNESIITKYINGSFDSLDPISVIGGTPTQKSSYSGDIVSQDSSLIFESGSTNRRGEFTTSEGILLSGPLGEYQPLLSDSLNNLCFYNFLENPTKETIEFLKLFSCTHQGYISLGRIKEVTEDGLLDMGTDFGKRVEKGEIIFNSYKKAMRR